MSKTKTNPECPAALPEKYSLALTTYDEKLADFLLEKVQAAREQFETIHGVCPALTLLCRFNGSEWYTAYK